MQLAPSFDTSFEQRLAKLDLSRVRERVAAETGMTSAEIDVAEDLYRKFLTLKFKFPEYVLTPPVIVDHMMDSHVLFTRQYEADCNMLFGYFLYHTPHVESENFDFETPFAKTRELYQSEYNVNFTRMGLRSELFGYAQCGI